MVIHLCKQNSLLNAFIAEMRHVDLQKDRMRFLKNLERTGEIIAYEISKTLEYETLEVTTALGMSEEKVLKKQPVIASVLRSGLPVAHGILNMFDKADNAFISPYKSHDKSENFVSSIEYVSCPDITARHLIISDALVATGHSILSAYRHFLTYGKPSHVHFAVLLASIEGIEFLKKNLPSKSCTIWVCAIDDELTAQALIVPGLGDVGDLSFGNKM